LNKFKVEKDDEELVRRQHVYNGKGAIDIRFFFRAAGHPLPALLLTYNIPPGASEGVHTHRPGDRDVGSFDEFYYILEGEGEMQVAGETLAVAAGDHVFMPNGVAHGIENTSTKLLKVYIVAVTR
jgi:oxalate decarboxylase/phosphoglucose isomerase-like protein (cupin superfamily)